MNGAAVNWEDGDMIKVEDADESRVYTLSSGACTKRAEFTGALPTPFRQCNRESEVQHFWQFGMQQFWEQSIHYFWEQECSNCPANLG